MTHDAKMARRFIVSGRVQGVGFRYFVQRQAKALGIAGWVQNLPDGRVEAFVEGLPHQLVQIEESLREGPSMSRVETVVSSEASPSLATEFVIRG